MSVPALANLERLARRYGVWAAFLLSMNIFVGAAFEYFHSRTLDVATLWSIRIPLWTGLLLFDNLVALLWYAHRTEQQYLLGLTTRRETNKPVVVTERRDNPDASGYFHYYFRNIGPGLALNVWWIDDCGREGAPRKFALGALGAGASRPVPGYLEGMLTRMDLAPKAHLLAAEGLATRTAQWTVMVNRLACGELTAALIELQTPRLNRSLDQLVTDEWDATLLPALRSAELVPQTK